MDTVVVIVIAVIAAVGGFLIGRSSAKSSAKSSAGSSVGGGSASKTRSAVSQSGTKGGDVAGDAFQLSLSRIGAYLRKNVDGPLSDAFKDRRLSLRKAAEDAVAAIEDLHFFLDDPSGAIGEDDLTRVVKEAVKDYEADWDQSIRLSSSGPVRVRTNTEALLDALYLILHNAGVFAQGKGVVATVSSDGEWGRVLIEDEGPGFTAEALSRAYDPFYTTSEGGLGLGLSHARKVVELQGGSIHLRNGPDGGAEVEIALPLA